LLATSAPRKTQLLTYARRDPSGAEVRDVSTAARRSGALIADPPQKDETATAILKKKKKPNSLM
jgi:hypothetical protein